jgi:two-component system, OmpR family, KDP operon response regulator KdpE
VPQRRVLVCDDEQQILRALRVVLHDAGYDVDAASGLGEALACAAARPPDAAIVDLVLPDGDGLELCTELRSWSRMPILVLSALDDEQQKVRALGAGADDYLTKPFSPRELLARLEATFRRVAAREEEAVVLVKGLEINLAAHTVARDGRELKLTPTEFKLLSVLARNRGRLMTSRALLAEVWGPAQVSDTALLRTHIANLRHKIEPPDPATWLYIETEAGVGYRFSD